MSYRQSEEWRSEVRSFLGRVPGRTAALALSSPELSLDHVLTLFIRWIEIDRTIDEVAEIYALVMLTPELRRSDMMVINGLIEEYHGEDGLDEIKRRAADINRKQGKMPWPKRTSTSARQS